MIFQEENPGLALLNPFMSNAAMLRRSHRRVNLLVQGPDASSRFFLVHESFILNP
jgi:hypothetical protein